VTLSLLGKRRGGKRGAGGEDKGHEVREEARPRRHRGTARIRRMGVRSEGEKMGSARSCSSTQRITNVTLSSPPALSSSYYFDAPHVRDGAFGIGGAVPNREGFAVLADGKDRARHLAAPAVDDARDETEEKRLPHGGGARAAHAEGEAPARVIGRVLPHRLDAVAEAHDVDGTRDTIGAEDVTLGLETQGRGTAARVKWIQVRREEWRQRWEGGGARWRHAKARKSDHHIAI
jgi:hypothetical protein